MSPNRRMLAAAAAVLTAVVLAAGVVVARHTGPAQPTLTPVSSPNTAAGPERDGAAITLEGADTLTGKAVSLADYSGKPVVISIWASWCPGCNAEARALGAFAEAHPEAAFVGIDFQDSKGAAGDFYEAYGWTFPSVFDPDGRIAFSLGLQGTPTTIFLDSGHREAARIVGETDERGFAKGLAAATQS